MLVIITGNIGVGKTTICKEVVRTLVSGGHSCGGILTYKGPDRGIIVKDVKTGKKEVLASINPVYSGPQVGKYYFNLEGIDFGIKAIETGKNSDVLVIDEIGPLELQGQGFVNAIELIKKEKVKNLLVVIRSTLLSALYPVFKSIPLVFPTTWENRDWLPREISFSMSGRMD